MILDGWGSAGVVSQRRIVAKGKNPYFVTPLLQVRWQEVPQPHLRIAARLPRSICVASEPSDGNKARSFISSEYNYM